jgi:hypothetical protein
LPPSDWLPADHPMSHSGPDLQDRTEWKHVLSDQERMEILVATGAAYQRSENIIDIGEKDFVLPTFAKTIHNLKQETMHGRGFVLLRGLPI